MKVLLSGYYGFNNAGDDAVLYAIVTALREIIPEIEITVLSNQPQKTSQGLSVKAMDRWSKIGLLKAIRQCDVLISGGGSLLQDVTSKNSILYYLGIIKLAQILGKKTFIYAQGIGPIHEKRNRALTKKILNKVTEITVRDFDSRAALVEIGVTKNILVAVDPVLGISEDEVDEMQGLQLLKQKNDYCESKKTIMVSARNWKNSTNLFEKIAKSCDELVLCGWQVIFLPFHYPDDLKASREILAKMKQNAIVLEENYTPKETMAILKNTDVILGMRLHSLIMGAVLKKPIVGLSYDPKVSSFMQLLRQKECYSVDHFNSQDLTMAINRAGQQKEEIVPQLEQLVEVMKKHAKAPAELVCTLDTPV